MSDTGKTLLGFAGTVIAALIPVFAPYIRTIVRRTLKRKTSAEKQPLPSGNEVRLQVRRFSLPIFTLGIALTALTLAYQARHSRFAPGDISFEEKREIGDSETKVAIDVPEGAVARVLIAAQANAQTDYTNNYRKPDEFRFQLTLKITDERDRVIAENSQWMPMFVNHHDPKQAPVEPIDNPTSFIPAGVGIIPLSCSTSAIIVLRAGQHTIFAKTYASNMLSPHVTLDSMAIFTRATK